MNSNHLITLISGLILLGFFSSWYVNSVATSTAKQLENEIRYKNKQISKKDSIISLNNQKIDFLIAQRTRVQESIKKMLENDEKISEDFKDAYLNPDSTDWNKLDSLVTVLRNR